MNFVAPPLPSTIAFVVLLLAVQGVMLVACRRAGSPEGATKRTVIAGGTILIVALATAALATWVFSVEHFAPIAIMLGSLNVLALGVSFSPFGARLGAALPMAAWVLFHAFRLPLEVLLEYWHSVGAVPAQITWSGENFDVFSGIAALAVGPVLLRRPNRGLAIAFHLFGLALLANVIRIAVRSVPGSPIMGFDEPILLALQAPYVWIVPFAVVTALIAHLVALRALWRPAA